jgi:hypothetical protein
MAVSRFLSAARFIGSRRVSSVALLTTGLVLLGLLQVSPQAQRQLADDYALSYGLLVGSYGFLLAGLALVVVFEPRVRSRLADGRWASGLVLAALLVSVAVVTRAQVDQPTRLVRPTLYPIFAAHSVFLCSIVLLLIPRQAAMMARFARAAWVVLAGLALVLIAAHVLGIGHFVRFDDLFDEVYKVSSATNFAFNGLLSPSFSASPFGSPDPSAARYYAVMGLWLRAVGDTSLWTLRTFPLLVGFAAALVTAVALWRIPDATRVQKLAGVVTLLALSSFVRTSHNLRNDIGLALCTALVLLFLLEAFRSQRGAYRYPLLAGLSLWVGMENIPTVTLIFGSVVGVMVILAAVDRRARRIEWLNIVAYAAGAAVACLAYAAVHYGPDVPGSLATMREYTRVYVENNSAPGGSWNRIPGFLRFSLAFSPAELFVVGASLGLLALQRRKTDRLIAAIPPLTTALMVWAIGGTMAYLVILTPLIAYAVARVLDRPAVLLVGAFVLLPALAAAPIHDLLLARQQGLNARQLEAWDSLTPRIPEGATVIGPNEFWLTLHQTTRFIGWDGLFLNRRRYQVEVREAIARLEPDVLICEHDATRFCDEYAPRQTPQPFDTGDDQFLLYFVDP